MLTTKQAMQRMGISKPRLHALVMQGRIDKLKKGRSSFYDEGQVQRYLDFKARNPGKTERIPDLKK